MRKIIIKNDKKYTYEDYMNFGEYERWEIIDGIAYMVSPGSSAWHQEISGSLAAEIRNYLKYKNNKTYKVYFRPLAVFLPKENETVETSSSIVEPDIIVCDKSKLLESGCAGSPELIIEILSAFSGAHDKIRKYKLYEENKVKEFWIVIPAYQIIERFSYNEKIQEYSQAECFGIDDIIAPLIFPDLQLKLAEIFPEMIEFGLGNGKDSNYTRL